MREQILYDLCYKGPLELRQALHDACNNLQENYGDGAQTKLFTLLWQYVEENTRTAYQTGQEQDFNRTQFREDANQLLGPQSKAYQKFLSKLYDTCLYQFDQKRRQELRLSDHLNRLNLFLALRCLDGAQHTMQIIRRIAKQERNPYLRMHALSQEFRILAHFVDRNPTKIANKLFLKLRASIGETTDVELHMILDYYYCILFSNRSKDESIKRILLTYQRAPSAIPSFSCLDARMMYVSLHAWVADKNGAFDQTLRWVDIGLNCFRSLADKQTVLVRWDFALLNMRSTILHKTGRLDELLSTINHIREETEKAPFLHRVEGVNTYCIKMLSYVLYKFDSEPLDDEAKADLSKVRKLYLQHQSHFSEQRRLLALFLFCAIYFLQEEYQDMEHYYWLLRADKHLSKDHHHPLMRTVELMWLATMTVRQHKMDVESIPKLIDNIEHQLKPWKYTAV
ncbi:MAG: hypothetical protein D6772_00265, partial [Bacteroidetes bacterium]